MTGKERFEALAAIEISSKNPGTARWTIQVGEMPTELARELEAKIVKLIFNEKRKARKAMLAAK